MTHRSRTGGPTKKRNQNKQGQTRKLHHPPPPRSSSLPPTSTTTPLPLAEGPFNPPNSELLSLIHRALHKTLSSDSFQDTIQKIKGLLYDQKWLEVFCGPEGLLEAYAGRWVPSRAACFRELMGSLIGELFGVDAEGEVAQGIERLGVADEEGEEYDGGIPAGEKGEEPDCRERDITSSKSIHHILSLGGGAGSELLAVSALIRATLLARPTHHPLFTWTGIDIGRWHDVLQKLMHVVRVDWMLNEELLNIDYVQGDLLASVDPTSEDKLKDGDGKSMEDVAARPIDLVHIMQDKPPTLITLFFTLTELLSQSRSSTLSLLSTLTAQSDPETLFLIVDSASDISEFSLGAQGRKWPVYMIIDTLLTRTTDGGNDGKTGGWEKIKGEDSRWFRFEEGVGAGWACKLENTRYWYRLYKRIQ
nr:cytoplasmic protein [Cryptococcus depauperatus CBS 7841]